MADLQFVDFALIPGSVRKENQFGLPDDFLNINATVLSRTTNWMPAGITRAFQVLFSASPRKQLISYSG